MEHIKLLIVRESFSTPLDMKSNPPELLLRNLAVVVLLSLLMSMGSIAQSLYTARGYWQETTKPSYLTIKEKKEKGQTLSADEAAYMEDYEAYLLTYYNRLTDDEKQLYQRMKDQWDRELALPLTAPQQPQQNPPQIEEAEFEWRGRDRAINAAYGIYYGATIAAIAELEDAAAVGIPVITGGLWMLGPVFNPKKYEGITESTMRAANSGKILGLVYGGSLGFALAGDSEESGKVALGLSTIGSITLGEIAFQTQKKKKISAGKIEIMRHYGFLGTGVGGAVLAATNTDNAHLVGLGLLGGGIGGLFLGNKVANKYDYTRGDGDALSSLGVISAGLGFAVIANELQNNTEPSDALYLVPAATAVAGTLIGQRQVKNVHLTKRQGSTINLSSAGGGLLGLGIMLLVDTESAAAWVAVPSTVALIAHQAVFGRYKKDNLLKNLKGQSSRNKRVDFSMKLMPENYLVNKNTPQRYIADPRLAAASPLVKMSLKFK
jgi:hypothetical protein